MKQNEFYKLISNLGPTEKAYFSKFAFKYGEAKDKPEALLFAIINTYLKNNTINNRTNLVVKKRYEDNKVSMRSFSVVKGKLKNLIIQSLASYDAPNDPGTGINNAYQECRALIKRGHYGIALPLVEKAISGLIQREDFNMVLLFTDLQAHIGVASNDHNLVNQSYETKGKALEELNSQHRLKLLYEEVYDLHRKEGVDSSGSLKKRLQKQIEAYEKLPVDGMSKTYSFNYYALGKTIGYILNDIDRTLANLERLIGIFKEDPSFFSGRERPILGIYADLISHGLEAGRTDYYDKYFKEFNSWDSQSAEVRKYIEHQSIRIRSIYLLFKQDYHKFNELLNEFDEHKIEMNPQFRDAITMDFITAYYKLGDHKKAMWFLNELLVEGQERSDLRSSALLIEMCIHFKDGEPDHVKKSLRNFDDLNVENESLLLLANYFRKVIKLPLDQRSELANKALNELRALPKGSISGSFNFIEMLEVFTK